MTPKIIARVLLAFLVLLLSTAALAEEKLVAKIGTVPVTTYELQREINRILPMKVSFHGKMSAEKTAQIQMDALDALIERGYKICYATQQQMTVAPERINKVVEDVRVQFGGEEAFNAAVAEETLAGLRAAISRALLAQDAEKTAVLDQVKVTDEDVAAYYEKNKETFFRPKQYRASHILVKVDPALRAEERAALQKKAAGLLERLRKGEDFYQLAYYNSDDRTKFVGGDLGYFHAGQTVPEFEAALESMQVGDVSELVQTRFGFHIVKLTELNDARQLAFSEVAEKVRETLVDNQQKQLYSAWIEPLKSSCPVEKYPLP